MSFIPTSCSDNCCPDVISGFCLQDGTPIAVIIQDNEVVGWINMETGIFTPGNPPPPITACISEPIVRDLDCEIDSVTICPPASGIAFDVEIVDQIGSCACHTEAVTSSVAASLTTVTLLPVFMDRKGAIFWNDSTSTAYVKFGAGASNTDFTWKIASQSGYELPTPVYIGIITAVWDAANGAMFITELI